MALPDSGNTLIFQTDQPWSPRTNIGAGTVLVYGLDQTTAARIHSWTVHGYRAAVMTGVAWGRYAPYLRGDFDGKQHWDETQQEKSGKLILHDGREVPYIAPSASYGGYLATGVLSALDAGAEAVYLEEPEFWADAGWSDSFKRSWTEFYHQPWQSPDSSPAMQYRASELKYFLYRRALQQVFEAVRQYGRSHGRAIPCYVATHSLLNYAQWQIVSPESSLLAAGVDGFVGQVWTGTARAPNTYAGVTRERTFETAFLEYGALQSLARASGKPIWYLNDPIEDNPNHSWTDYRQNWESTLIASLLQPAVARFEVLPWPNRIFDETAVYPSSEADASQSTLPQKTRIPQAYATELQTVFHALGEMERYNESTRWERAGTQGLGVLVSDSLMFERAAPQPSDPHLGQFYGLAMPLLLQGMPVEPVSIETATSTPNGRDPLARYRVLLLSYEGQKPPSPAFHTALAAWVRAGGALVVVDNDKDSYNKISAWWNSGSHPFATPREQLFSVLGLSSTENDLQHVGNGVVLYAAQSPSSLAESSQGADVVLKLVNAVAGARGFPLSESSALVLRRGPYVVAAGLPAEAGQTSFAGRQASPTHLRGDFIDLFDADLTEREGLDVAPDRRALLLDVSTLAPGPPRILAASAKIRREQATATTLVFEADGIEGTNAAVRILATTPPRQVTVDGKILPQDQYRQSGRTLLLKFPNHATAQQIRVNWH
ncbi:MAG: hypothetical protein ACRYFU_16775 [Janthinobacterium lividum]